MTRPCRGIALFPRLLLVGLAACGEARAQVQTDGSLGPALSLSGTDLVVDANLGKQRGGNLFHSFRQLNVPAGGSVAFTGPDGVQRVISRVTGGSPSNILGTLACEIPGASFYLMNPAGVVFGPGASVLVGGSFVVTTADRLDLSDGGVFHASTDPARTVLTSAPPSAFGFLTATPAGVQFQGPDSGNPTVLQSGAGQALAVVAGDVTLRRTRLVSAGGRIHLVSSAAAGSVALEPESPQSLPQVDSLSALGAVSLSDGAAVSTRGGGGNRVTIDAGDLSMSDSSLDASIEAFVPTADGQGVRLRVRGQALLERSVVDSTIATVLGSDVAGGPIEVQAGQLVLDGGGVPFGSVLQAESQGGHRGVGGSITLEVGDLTLRNGGAVTTTTFGAGRSGPITITAGGLVSIDGSGTASADAVSTGILSLTTRLTQPAGASGAITVQSAQLTLFNTALLETSSRGAGVAGDIAIQTGRLTIDGAAAENFTGISSSALAIDPSREGRIGRAGRVQIDVLQTVNVTRGGSVASAGFQADGQPIVITAGGSVVVSEGSIVTARSGFDGGNVILRAPVIEVLDSTLSAQARLDGGNIDLQADTVLLRRANVNASSLNTGGNVQVNADVLALTVASQVSADARLGQGGQIVVEGGGLLAAPPLVRTGPGEVTAADGSTLSATSAAGPSGQVTLNSPTLDLSGDLVALRTTLLSSATSLVASCAQQYAKSARISTFFVRGEGGLPPTPDFPLGSPTPPQVAPP